MPCVGVFAGAEFHPLFACEWRLDDFHNFGEGKFVSICFASDEVGDGGLCEPECVAGLHVVDGVDGE